MKLVIKGISLLVISLWFSVMLVAQDNSSTATAWKGVLLSPTGANEVNGVHVFYKQISCSGEAVVVLKFVNNNEFDVKAEWYNAVFTQDKQWVKNNDRDQLQAMMIKGSSALSGDCEAEDILRINLKELIDVSDFNMFKTDNLVISAQ